MGATKIFSTKSMWLDSLTQFKPLGTPKKLHKRTTQPQIDWLLLTSSREEYELKSTKELHLEPKLSQETLRNTLKD
jgi:hypothetical protein